MERIASLRDLVARIEPHLGMYVARSTYLGTCTFLDGHSWGSGDDTLGQFSNWVLIRTGCSRPELAWAWRVLCVLYPEDALPDVTAFDETQNRAATDTLFALLNEFFAETKRP